MSHQSNFIQRALLVHCICNTTCFTVLKRYQPCLILRQVHKRTQLVLSDMWTCWSGQRGTEGSSGHSEVVPQLGRASAFSLHCLLVNNRRLYVLRVTQRRLCSLRSLIVPLPWNWEAERALRWHEAKHCWRNVCVGGWYSYHTFTFSSTSKIVISFYKNPTTLVTLRSLTLSHGI